MCRDSEKQFKTKHHTGRVVAAEIDTDTNDVIWKVRCDDRDKEVLDARQLKRVLCAAGDLEMYSTRSLV